MQNGIATLSKPVASCIARARPTMASASRWASGQGAPAAAMTSVTAMLIMPPGQTTAGRSVGPPETAARNRSRGVMVLGLGISSSAQRP